MAAEQMLDSFFVEPVVSELLLAGKQSKLGGWDERKEQALHAAMRTIALDHLGEIGLNLEGNLPTVAFSLVLIGHRYNLVLLL
jgi:hypothetical protein